MDHLKCLLFSNLNTFYNNVLSHEHQRGTNVMNQQSENDPFYEENNNYECVLMSSLF